MRMQSQPARLRRPSPPWLSRNLWYTSGADGCSNTQKNRMRWLYGILFDEHCQYSKRSIPALSH